MPVPHYLYRSRTSTRTGMDSHRQLFAHPPEHRLCMCWWRPCNQRMGLVIPPTIPTYRKFLSRPVSIQYLYIHYDSYYAAWLSVRSTLGFSGSRFHLIRRLNKCPNTKIILETLTSAIGGTEFPQLILTWTKDERLTFMLEPSISVIGYLQTGPGIFEPLRRIRLYNALASEKYNERLSSF